MAFQDFDHITERREAERQRKFRKRVTIAAITAFVLVVLIAAGLFALVTLKNDDDSSSGKPIKEVNRSQKLIQTICNGTNYKASCNDTLSTAAKKNPSLDKPQEFLKVAVLAISDEVAKAMNKASKFNFNSEEEHSAFNVCKKLVEDAKRELKTSISHIDGQNLLVKFKENANELNNWLSAVISYQQTCVDGFPEGESKSDMERILTATRELTSNSLAIVQQFSTYLSTISNDDDDKKNNKGGSARRLLESGIPSLDKDGFPTWLSHEDKRMLQEKHNDQDDKPKPNATVAKDGSGNFKTIQAALDAMPKNHAGRYVIYIKEGVYDEVVTVKEFMWNVTLYGDGSQKTIITGRKNCAEKVPLLNTASFVAEGQGIMCKSMGFRNTAGPSKEQAVAARVQSDRAVFLNCRFEGYQDTLWLQAHRQFYRSCVITGTVDFIFGDAAAVFQNCQILVRKGLIGKPHVIVAQGRNDSKETTATVLQNCRIEPEEDLAQAKKDFKSYLGRPWKAFSRVVIMESTIADFIQPEGWTPYRGDYGIDTLYYAEYNNKGDGAKTDGRVKWPGYKKINRQEAEKFTVGNLFTGEWIKGANTPVHFGLMNN